MCAGMSQAEAGKDSALLQPQAPAANARSSNSAPRPDEASHQKATAHHLSEVQKPGEGPGSPSVAQASRRKDSAERPKPATPGEQIRLKQSKLSFRSPAKPDSKQLADAEVVMGSPDAFLASSEMQPGLAQQPPESKGSDILSERSSLPLELSIVSGSPRQASKTQGFEAIGHSKGGQAVVDDWLEPAAGEALSSLLNPALPESLTPSTAAPSPHTAADLSKSREANHREQMNGKEAGGRSQAGNELAERKEHQSDRPVQHWEQRDSRQQASRERGGSEGRNSRGHRGSSERHTSRGHGSSQRHASRDPRDAGKEGQGGWEHPGRHTRPDYQDRGRNDWRDSRTIPAKGSSQLGSPEPGKGTAARRTGTGLRITQPASKPSS